MIRAEYYVCIYLVVVTIMTLIYANKYKCYSLGKNETMLLVLLSLMMTLFIGFRPIYREFVDMMNYTLVYDYNLGMPFVFDWKSENLFFDNWFSFCSSSFFDKYIFFFSIALIYFIGAAVACRKLFKTHSVIAYLFFLGAFSTFSYGTNGIKAGAAMSIFFLAVAWWNNKVVAIILLWVALGFHHSMLLPISAFVLCYFVHKPKWFFYGWLICLFLSAAHVTSFMNVIADLVSGEDTRAADYLVTNVEWGGKSGFRYDFVLYSAMPVLVGYYLILKCHVESRTYHFMWSLYCVINAFWLICMYAQFTNRIAYVSGGIYPFVLCYPFLMVKFDDRQYKWLANIAFLHLGFTLFMNIIYD